MRLLLVLFELLIPIIILGTIFAIFINLKKKKSIKNFEKSTRNFKNNAINRHNIPFKQFLIDWETFINVFEGKIPNSSYLELNNIRETLESLQAKSQIENLDSKQKPQQIYMIADIIYKHAPDMVSEFVQLPKNLINTKNEQGQSPTELINENTKILAKSCREIATTLFDQNLQKMRVQQAYLNAKFSEHSLEDEK